MFSDFLFGGDLLREVADPNLDAWVWVFRVSGVGCGEFGLRALGVLRC